jgi:hypothetical protein
VVYHKLAIGIPASNVSTFSAVDSISGEHYDQYLQIRGYRKKYIDLSMGQQYIGKLQNLCV